MGRVLPVPRVRRRGGGGLARRGRRAGDREPARARARLRARERDRAGGGPGRRPTPRSSGPAAAPPRSRSPTTRGHSPTTSPGWRRSATRWAPAVRCGSTPTGPGTSTRPSRPSARSTGLRAAWSTSSSPAARSTSWRPSGAGWTCGSPRTSRSAAPTTRCGSPSPAPRTSRCSSARRWAGWRARCGWPRRPGCRVSCRPRWRPASGWRPSSRWPGRCRSWTSRAGWARWRCSTVISCPTRWGCGRSTAGSRSPALPGPGPGPARRPRGRPRAGALVARPARSGCQASHMTKL